MSALAAALLKTGPMDPLRLNIQDLVNRIAVGVRNDLTKREMRNLEDYSIKVELVFNMYAHKSYLVLTVVNNKTGDRTLTIEADTVSELLSEENRAMIYLLLGS